MLIRFTMEYVFLSIRRSLINIALQYLLLFYQLNLFLALIIRSLRTFLLSESGDLDLGALTIVQVFQSAGDWVDYGPSFLWTNVCLAAQEVFKGVASCSGCLGITSIKGSLAKTIVGGSLLWILQYS